MKHHDIVRTLADSKAVDYAKLGTALGKLGPALVDSEGFYGMIIGKHMILACMMPAHRLESVGELSRLAGVAQEVKTQ